LYVFGKKEYMSKEAGQLESGHAGVDGGLEEEECDIGGVDRRSLGGCGKSEGKAEGGGGIWFGKEEKELIGFLRNTLAQFVVTHVKIVRDAEGREEKGEVVDARVSRIRSNRGKV